MAMLGAFARARRAVGRSAAACGFVMLAAFPGNHFGAIVERVAMRPLAAGRRFNALIATIGLFLVFHHLAGWIWGYDPYAFPSLFSPEPVVLAGARISQASIGILAVSLGVMAAALRVSTRRPASASPCAAASMNRRAARLMGVNVARSVVSMTACSHHTASAWSLACCVAPLTFLDSEMIGDRAAQGVCRRDPRRVSTACRSGDRCLVIGVARTCLAPTSRPRSRTRSPSASSWWC